MQKPNPIDVHVGSRVRMRRLMLDMSQTALAEKLRLTFQQVQKYEKGANRIGASRLQQISNILQVPVAFFFEGVPDARGQAAVSEPAPDFVREFCALGDGLLLAQSFQKIQSSKKRRLVLKLVEEMARQSKR